MAKYVTEVHLFNNTYNITSGHEIIASPYMQNARDTILCIWNHHLPYTFKVFEQGKGTKVTQGSLHIFQVSNKLSKQLKSCIKFYTKIFIDMVVYS